MTLMGAFSTVTLILGGARSGKSRLAQQLAESAGRVTYVATAQAGQDEEMAARIEKHRADRPSFWRTIEEPVALARAVEFAASHSDAILVDCLTLWLSNLFWEHRDEGPQEGENIAIGELERMVATRGQCRLILVSNEVGWGTVPELAVTRAFRDAQGRLNQRAAEAADEVILTVAGLPLYLKTFPQNKGLP
jgi:adenosylcobinamide kinase / adenosylcobinamide-phosphate guanylyltransferase